MSEERHDKRKNRRRTKRKVKLIFNIIIIAIILYLATLAVSIFGGGELSSKLREAEFIDAPVKFAEENLLIMNIDTKSNEETTKITVSEDKILYNQEEIQIEDLAKIITDNDAQKVQLVDDGAKRVTYAAVYDELERLGVIIEEK